MKNLLAGAAIALALVAPVDKAAAANNDCKEMLVANGLVFRGSAVCNPAWLDRPGSLTIEDASHTACKGPPKELKAYLAQGFAKFDAMVKSSGKSSACAALDKMISDVTEYSKPAADAPTPTAKDQANDIAKDIEGHAGSSLKCVAKPMKNGGVDVDCK